MSGAYDERVEKRMSAALATVSGLITTGVGTGYVLIINSIDHAHEQQAVRQNPFVFLLPTWPSVAAAVLLVAFLGLTIMFTFWAAGNPSPRVPSETADSESPTPLVPSRGLRAVSSHLWRDRHGMRGVKQLDDRLRVKWASGAPAGWLYPNDTGGWDATNNDLEDIGSAPTPEAGMLLIKQYLLTGRKR